MRYPRLTQPPDPLAIAQAHAQSTHAALMLVAGRFGVPVAVIRRQLRVADLESELAQEIVRLARETAHACLRTGEAPPAGPSLLDQATRAIFSRLQAEQIRQQNLEADRRLSERL